MSNQWFYHTDETEVSKIIQILNNKKVMVLMATNCQNAAPP